MLLNVPSLPILTSSVIIIATNNKLVQIIDSGTSIYIYNTLSLFIKFHEIYTIIQALSLITTLIVRSSIRLPQIRPNSKIQQVLLTNILYILEAAYNLLSITALIDFGVYINFYSLSIIKNDKETISIIQRNARGYLVLYQDANKLNLTSLVANVAEHYYVVIIVVSYVIQYNRLGYLGNLILTSIAKAT